eukprot:CAMPEP_0172327786 /NCGR_PEP_ID=MMETSP1058-20130122/60013_1 /TAXON_ID=83371 /ORGANISM="Detonula confervacea, Strain CCMP 353" /LENGTH=426 /DNA_ID=CAMNT_0013044871 /DNA_START=194 /DNA_END=1474 /DNA_ORIENTATION=+
MAAKGFKKGGGRDTSSKKKCMAGIVGVTIVIAITVGLGIGLTHNNNPKVSSASSVVTLEECLKEEDALWPKDETAWLEEEDEKDVHLPTYEPTPMANNLLIPASVVATSYSPTPVDENLLPAAATDMPTSGSTPTVSTEVTGPPTKSSRDGERELFGRELLRGGDAQSKKVSEKVVASWSKPRKLAECEALLGEYNTKSVGTKSGKSSGTSKSDKSGDGGGAKSCKSSKSGKSSKCTDVPSQSPSYPPTQPPTNNPTTSPTQPPTNNPTTSPTNNPTASPTNNPTASPTPPRLNKVANTNADSPKRERCQGFCNPNRTNQNQCKVGLVCSDRTARQLIPGCLGRGVSGKNYCYDPADTPLSRVAGTNAGSPKRERCEGFCDPNRTNQCKVGLVCSNRVGQDPIPGCLGTGISGKNYCYDPDDSPAP